MPTCSRCNQPAVYLRRYSAERLCKACLVSTTIQRVKRTINREGMLRENDRIMVAISGGKDSATLLDVLYKIEQNFPRSEIIPVTIDEGITGYRDKALEKAHALVKLLGLRIEVRTFQKMFGYTLDEIVRQRDDGMLGACSYCGVLRRRALNDLALEMKADVVATGHNLDDEAQTVLMNILRGDGLRIARTSRLRTDALEGFVPRIKPLHELTERDIVAYAHCRELPYHDEPCPYAEEAFRNDLRTFLNQMEHRRPGTLLAIARSAEAIAETIRSGVRVTNFNTCIRCGAPTTAHLCKTCMMLDEIQTKSESDGEETRDTL